MQEITLQNLDYTSNDGTTTLDDVASLDDNYIQLISAIQQGFPATRKTTV